ncbi:MAG: FtsX-like permease family protein [Bacteroidota bacterium]|nr:FtsX-like permease family protein [Bacteroidota bacterium]
MIAIKLAFKNLLGAGLRTWLNVSVLSFAFVLLIFYNGMIDGWNRQGRHDTKAWQIAEGQYWHPKYDKYDHYTIQDSHQKMSDKVLKFIKEGKLTPTLLSQASIYPDGRIQSVLLKGVEPEQTILKLPTATLDSLNDGKSAIIGARMAKDTHLKKGDFVLLRWRDKNGMFDAVEIKIAAVFETIVPAIDNGQMYLPISVLQKMKGMENQASILTSARADLGKIEDWEFKSTNFLLKEFDSLIQSKKVGGMVLSGSLLIIALLAIFDTQVLSIFRRRKEIGTYIALGMTRRQVVGIFTVEGSTHSILAAILGALYGIPLFLWLDTTGIPMGKGTDDMGITIADTIYPYYSMSLIVSSILLIVISATIVSYIPSRKISKMKPTDAIKGKTQ